MSKSTGAQTPCPGGCDSLVPEGQTCFECATAAVQRWVVAKHAASRAPKNYPLTQAKRRKPKK